MSAEDSMRVVRAFYDAGNAGEVSELLALVSDDVRWTNIGTTRFSMTCNGKQDLVENLIGPVFARLQSGIKAHIENMFAEGNWVAVQLTGEATTVEGTPYNNTYCHIFRVRDGRIAEVTEYFDSELVTRVLVAE